MSKVVQMSISLSEEIDAWIQKYQAEMGFSTKSAAVRRCIVIAKNLLEHGSEEEISKFVIGENLKNRRD